MLVAKKRKHLDEKQMVFALSRTRNIASSVALWHDIIATGELPLQLLQPNRDSCTDIKKGDCNAASGFKPEIT